LDPALPEDLSSPAASFYFDLASPLAYLAAERILHVLGGRARVNAEWQPVLARELSGAESFDASGGDDAFRAREEQDAFRAELAGRARELDLQPLRWPEPFPFDSALAMRVATYAKSIGRTVPFAQAAFRQAFAGGRSLAEPDNVLIAAAACEMHPTAVLRGAELRSVADQLASTTEAAAAAGVTDVPAIVFFGAGSSRDGSGPERAHRVCAQPAEVFVGEHAVEDAAAYVAAGADEAREGGETAEAGNATRPTSTGAPPR
jgi:2-hydroxychromene-2-carboxylate isomerase